jgi:hypothetical protein
LIGIYRCPGADISIGLGINDVHGSGYRDAYRASTDRSGIGFDVVAVRRGNRNTAHRDLLRRQYTITGERGILIYRAIVVGIAAFHVRRRHLAGTLQGADIRVVRSLGLENLDGR